MILKLLRINQYYKNLVIFLAVFFSGNLLNTPMIFSTFLGFISLCLISSTNYIINDIVDIEKDKQHPEKRLRPIASGKIKIYQAIILAVLLFLFAVTLASHISLNFLFAVFFLFIFTAVYTFILKKIPFLDIFAIAINFVARAIGGALIINVWISPFLILCPFFLSLFLSTGKRYSDMLFLKKKILYPKKTLKILIYAAFTSLILSFIIYCILVNPYLLLTLPIAAYALFEYLKLILSASKIARHPELIFTNLKLIAIILIFSILTLVINYRTIFF